MHEAVELLSSYLKIDTTNPPGNEDRGVAFLAEIFDKEGMAYKTYKASSGRSSILSVIPGTGEKGAVILLNHIDVVPAQADEWSVHPFSGEIRDGYIYGRGALDMKGQGILELLAFLEFKRKGLTPCRDLIFLAVASLLFGASDSRFFRKKGIPCYGVNPVLLSLEELGKIHGIDERISEENMIRGTGVFIDIVKKLCRV